VDLLETVYLCAYVSRDKAVYIWISPNPAKAGPTLGGGGGVVLFSKNFAQIWFNNYVCPPTPLLFHVSYQRVWELYTRLHPSQKQNLWLP